MRLSVSRGWTAILVLASAYIIPNSHARADNWGCEVILCLSNPGGPTQFAACHPPIEKLWRELAKGRSFPTCSGVGFSASRPGYEPYFCNDGFSLTSRLGSRGREVACVSDMPQVVSSRQCFDNGLNEALNRSRGRWARENDKAVCKATVTVAPSRREKPRFVDVTIDGVSRQRVWF